MGKLKKYVVFDLDETLGSFVELGILYEALYKVYGVDLINNHFNKILDIFPEFLRPNIMSILLFVKRMKQLKRCEKVFIYTNNQGPETWAKQLMEYFHYKLNYELFDQIIPAYKVNGKIVEPRRSSHDKSYKDLIKCTDILEGSKICFIDDQYHEKMNTENVCYINIKPYKQFLALGDIANRYFDFFKPNINKLKFVNTIINFMSIFNLKIISTNEKELNIDNIIGKKMLLHIKKFFNYKDNKTRKKIKKKNTNKSRKK